MRELPSTEVLNLNLIYNPFDGSLKWRISGEDFGKKYKDGYISGYFNGQTYGAHRIIYKMMTGCDPKIVDHSNGCRSDNRWKNLSDTTPLENSRNLGRDPRNSSGYTGVWKTRHGTYRAAISVNHKRIWLGSFPCRDSAIEARREAERVHGFHVNHGRIDL